jgi:ABC-type Zn uptake system ZnuABC Zn-binding protein ZnuA
VRLTLPLPALALALVLGAAGCGDDTDGGSGAKLTVVATTTHVADLAGNVGGGRADVHAIERANADPHDYEPRPSDARRVAEAAVVLRSGGDLDDWLDDLVESGGGRPRVVTLLDSVRTIEGEGEIDPHWWQDPRNAERAVNAIRDTLVEADRGGRTTYERNAAAYLRKLRRLDRAIADCIGRVSAAKRKLVTTHDALGYFAKRYDLEVVGALIPSLSTQAQPSARDIQKLVEQIREEGVEAIFPETALNPKLERAVSREAGARVGRRLWADALGPKGSDGATYLQSMASNTQALVEGMTGGVLSCRPAV